ncbi:hypothetical protein B2J93_5466 [Marssonina coronariae]|uniref:Uncharacterized protein n=1 Tax=Diplocarpon coronariae TaxID=2795749 RepID=A0A218Z1S3_9HELO|nr:hypothetical protein B2J93_5466 [Marssonina coronariae]
MPAGMLRGSGAHCAVGDSHQGGFGCRLAAVETTVWRAGLGRGDELERTSSGARLGA